MRRTRVLIIAAAALLVAVIAFAGSALQFGLTVGEAFAQPAADALAPGDDAMDRGSAEAFTLPGGSVRPPAQTMVPIPTEPGMPREGIYLGADQTTGDAGPLGTRGPNSDTDFWSFVRKSGIGAVTIPDGNSAMLVQDGGMRWLEWRAKGGPLQTWGGYAILGMLVALAVFFLLRGRIRIEHGRSGETIERFRGYERFAHWLVAGAFVVLALSGLNLLYGKDYLLPLVGKEAFATVTLAGKWVHTTISWAFMAGLAMMFVIWVAHNIPGRADLNWLLKGGGMFTKGTHPPAPKFNAGQKILFWAIILTGLSISLSGISLLFPYQAPLFGKTFMVLNETGLSRLFVGGPLQTDLSPLMEMQYAQIWHSIMALAMITIIIAHIYIGTLGMEGAFSAMGSGHVDRNWALEHHALWVAEEDTSGPRRARPGAMAPAE